MDLNTVIELAEKRKITPSSIKEIVLKDQDVSRLEALCRIKKITTTLLTTATIVTFGLFVYAARNYGLASSPLIIPSILGAAHARLQYDLCALYSSILRENHSTGEVGRNR